MISVLKKLLNEKAAGIDGIPNRGLKDSAELIAPSLTDLFNFSISTKTYPGDFKIAKVSPVFKRGDKQIWIIIDPFQFYPLLQEYLKS